MPINGSQLDIPPESFFCCNFVSVIDLVAFYIVFVSDHNLEICYKQRASANQLEKLSYFRLQNPNKEPVEYFEGIWTVPDFIKPFCCVIASERKNNILASPERYSRMSA